MKRAYIAGKLNAPDATEYLRNCSVMMVAAEKLRLEGYAVFNPCLDMLMGLKFGHYHYDDYALNNIEWIKGSDILFVLPDSENSIGTLKEIAFAEENNVEVVYL